MRYANILFALISFYLFSIFPQFRIIREYCTESNRDTIVFCFFLSFLEHFINLFRLLTKNPDKKVEKGKRKFYFNKINYITFWEEAFRKLIQDNITRVCKGYFNKF